MTKPIYRSIKINRAIAKAGITSCPSKIDSLVNAVPDAVQAKLNSTELAKLYKAMDAYWAEARRHTEAVVILEGAIFDPTAGKMREIAPAC